MRRYDTFWERFKAIAIDGAILGIITQFVQHFSSSDSLYENLAIMIIVSNLPYVYEVILHGRYGQTIGKMIMKVKVVDNATELPLSYSQSFMRNAVPIILENTSILLYFILFSDVDFSNFKISTLGYIFLILPAGIMFTWSLLEIITMLFDEKRRALHDKIADTVVALTRY